jgi:hypothetical protein
MTTAAEVLEQSRQDKGAPSFAKIHLAVYDRIGIFAPTAETLRTYHRGTGPAVPNLTVLLALCDYYGVTLSDLGYEAPKGLPDLVFRASRWKRETPAPVAA